MTQWDRFTNAIDRLGQVIQEASTVIQGFMDARAAREILAKNKFDGTLISVESPAGATRGFFSMSGELLRWIADMPMPKPAASVYTGHFPLNSAMLCCDIECNTVFESGPESCPSCLGKQFFAVASLVDRPGLQFEIEKSRKQQS